MTITYRVIRTPCYPAEYFGGPTWNGQIMDNATCYYFRTLEEAQEFCDKMNAKLKKE